MADDTAPRHPNDRPSERTWFVPTTTITADGEEVPVFENVQYELQEIAHTLMRIGGIVTIAAKRVELPPQGRFPARHETEMLVVRWQQFTPATPKAAPAPAPKIAVSGDKGEEESTE
jgi:hypothetical protein